MLGWTPCTNEPAHRARLAGLKIRRLLARVLGLPFRDVRTQHTRPICSSVATPSARWRRRARQLPTASISRTRSPRLT